MLYELNRFPLFAGCERRDIDALIAKTPHRLIAYREGDFIAMAGQECRSLYLLCEGEAEARMTNEEGKEITIDRLHAPEVLAPAFLYGSENRFPVTVRAITPCHLWSISKGEFFNWMQGNEAVLRNFIRLISDRSVFLSQRLNAFALQDLTTRLLAYLDEKKQIDNLQETAVRLGVARPSLSRALSVLLQKGMVKKAGTTYLPV